MKWFQSLKNLYKWSAITMLNVLLLFVLFNIVLGILYFIKDTLQEKACLCQNIYRSFNEDGSPVKTKKRSTEQIRLFDFSACKELGGKYEAEVLDNFYDYDLKGLIYQPWVQFTHAPFVSKGVNVILDERGFPIRKTLNPEKSNKKPIVRIFTFGGSTTFCYNTSDEHTWPTYLSQILNERVRIQGKSFNIEVINYGREDYYPSQEAILLLDLLRSGHRPGLVVFLDGLNLGEEEDAPELSIDLERVFQARQFYECLKLEGLLFRYKRLPLVRFIKSFHGQFKIFQQNETSYVQSNQDKMFNYFVNRFKKNKELIKLICMLYGVKPVFLLQPNNFYKYNLKLYRNKLYETLINEDTEQIKLVKRFYEEIQKDKSYIDLSNLFELWGKDKKALVDVCHYSPTFNKFLATQIATHIDLNKLPVFSSTIDIASATGAKRSIVTYESLNHRKR